PGPHPPRPKTPRPAEKISDSLGCGVEVVLMQSSFPEVVLTFVVAHVWDIVYAFGFLVVGACLQIAGDHVAGGGD
ncbi:hypothetical protein, partial [Ornithinibacter aureus]|uniref:hypothetical protein n=1 Tax=Ornithinibacter aureus TaxID=622664 RepID=UPI0031EA8D47